MTYPIHAENPPVQNENERLRRAELERLTGCPIHHVIEGTCHEAGCQNAALELQKELVFSEENCLRLRDVALDEGGSRLPTEVPPSPNGELPRPEPGIRPLYMRNGTPSYVRDAAPIFQTKPRLRCVL